MSKTYKIINFYDPQNIKAHSVFFFFTHTNKIKNNNKLYTHTYTIEKYKKYTSEINSHETRTDRYFKTQ